MLVSSFNLSQSFNYTVHVQIVSAQIVSAQFVSAQIVSAQIVSCTNCIGYNLYRTQIVSSPFHFLNV